jgi:hypothetical protein
MCNLKNQSPEVCRESIFRADRAMSRKIDILLIFVDAQYAPITETAEHLFPIIFTQTNSLDFTA